MGDTLYGRRCRVTLAVPVDTPGDYTHTTADLVEINEGDPADPAVNGGLRVQFKASKTSEKEPNTCEVTITNLAPTRRSSLQQKGVKLRLEAGYVATGVTQIFVGDVRTTDQVREGPHWLTKIRLADGERAFRFARAAQSFGPGTDAGTILKYLANQLGVPLGHVTADMQVGPTFDHGYVVHGPVQASLDDLVGGLGFHWSIQDGALQVLAPGEALTIAIPEISPSTGLIGSPEMGTAEKKGQPALVKFRSLIIPTRPGALVHLTSNRYNGNVRVKKCDFTGDTAGGDWYTDIQGVVHQQ